MDDTDAPGRKVLRQEGDVLMWQEYIEGPHKDTGQLLRYFVGRSAGPSKSFSAPTSGGGLPTVGVSNRS